MFIPPNELVRRERARRSYYHFIKEFWEVLEPGTPLSDNWHIKVLCDEFQKDILRVGQRLPKTRDHYVNIPPRCMKSYIFSIMSVGWAWVHYPYLKFIVASHTDTLANELSVKSRVIIQSEKYQRWFGEIYQLHGAQNEKVKFFNNQGGERIATSTAAAITGSGADCLVGETMIATEWGNMTIEEIVNLKEMPRVLSYNHETEQTEWRNIVATKVSVSNDIHEITTNKGRYIRATGKHRIYTTGFGYTQAQLLGNGDKLIISNGGVPNMSGEKIGRQNNMLDMLSKSEEDCIRTGMLPVSQGIQEKQVQCGKINKEGTKGFLLLRNMLGKTSFFQKSSKMRDMFEYGTQKDDEILFDRMSSEIAQEQEKIEANQLSLLSKRIYGEEYKKYVLLDDMQKQGSFKENDWNWEFSLQGGKKLLQMVLRDAPLDIGKGEGSLCSLSQTSNLFDKKEQVWKDETFQYDNSPYRRKSEEQCGGELGGNLLNMSYNSSSFDGDTVQMVVPIRDRGVRVYDIQVEGNHNFFANEILVHNCIIIDDYLKPQDASSITKLNSANEWFNVTLYSRLNSQTIGSRWLIMQRLHEDDIIAQIKDQYDGIVLPITYDERIVKLPEGVVIEGYAKDGDLFWGERFPAEEVERIKRNMAFGFAAQYMQVPNPLDGAVFNRDDFQFYDSSETPAFDDLIISCDTAVKTGQHNDYSVLLVMGLTAKGHYYVVDMFREKVQYHELKQNLLLLNAKYQPTNIIIEDRSSGHQLIQELRESGLSIPMATNIQAEGGGFKGAPDKLYRVSTVIGYYRGSQVYVPSDKAWTVDIIEEHLAFSPAGTHKHDDICFVAGTQIATLFGNKPIEEITKNDWVITPSGICRVLTCGYTGKHNVVSNIGLTGTPNHPVFTKDGFRDLGKVTIEETKQLNWGELLRWKYRKILYSMEQNIPSWGREDIILASQKPMQEEDVLKDFMLQFGNFMQGKQFQKAITFTIRMGIGLITTSLIWNVYQLGNTVGNILLRIKKNKLSIWQKLGKTQRNGINQKQERNGIANMPKIIPLENENNRNMNACGVKKNSWLPITIPNIADHNVGESTGNLRECMTSNYNVNIAGQPSKPYGRKIPSKQNEPVANLVPLSSIGQTGENVYNLTVDKEHVYFANNILVSNCDSLSQALNFFNLGSVRMWSTFYNTQKEAERENNEEAKI